MVAILHFFCSCPINPKLKGSGVYNHNHPRTDLVATFFDDYTSRMQHIVRLNTNVMNGGKYTIQCQKLGPIWKKNLERILNAHPRDVASIVEVRTRAGPRGSNSRAGGDDTSDVSLVQLPFISGGIWSGGCSGIVRYLWERSRNFRMFTCGLEWLLFTFGAISGKKFGRLRHSDFLRVRFKEKNTFMD